MVKWSLSKYLYTWQVVGFAVLIANGCLSLSRQSVGDSRFSRQCLRVRLSVRPSAVRLYAVRRREVTVTARPPTGIPTLGGRTGGCEQATGRSSRVPSSRVSLTHYRLSQRRYGVVDNNGDFSPVRRDSGAYSAPKALAATDVNAARRWWQSLELTGCRIRVRLRNRALVLEKNVRNFTMGEFRHWLVCTTFVTYFKCCHCVLFCDFSLLRPVLISLITSVHPPSVLSVKRVAYLSCFSLCRFFSICVVVYLLSDFCE